MSRGAGARAAAAAPAACERPRRAVDRIPDLAVVVPTVGRPSLTRLLTGLCATLPGGAPVVVVDDRPAATAPLAPRVEDPRLRVVRSGGRGPAAARNAGWRAAHADWIVFVDDDVEPPPDWADRLVADLRGAPPDVAGVQGRIEVPLPADRSATDWERNVAGLAGATWITADMAVRRTALVAVGGFDERFPRAYREDTDLALRLFDAGWRLAVGGRRVRHPVRPAPWWISMGLQRGNSDDVLLERLHGPAWRRRIGVAPGARSSYPATTVLGVAALAALVSGHRRIAGVAGAAWAVRSAGFAWRRAAPGPRSARELAAVAATSVAIPPVACYHRLRGQLRWRSVPRHQPGPRPEAGPEGRVA